MEQYKRKAKSKEEENYICGILNEMSEYAWFQKKNEIIRIIITILLCTVLAIPGFLLKNMFITCFFSIVLLLIWFFCLLRVYDIYHQKIWNVYREVAENKDFMLADGHINNEDLHLLSSKNQLYKMAFHDKQSVINVWSAENMMPVLCKTFDSQTTKCNVIIIRNIKKGITHNMLCVVPAYGM